MRCKNHPTDLSTAAGVCASCLRERLSAVLAAQAQKEAQLRQAQETHRKSESCPPVRPDPIAYPRSVSPYVSHRKSDVNATATWPQKDHRFFSTPQVGPTGSITVEFTKKQKKKKSWFFSGLFRSKSDKTEPLPVLGPDPGRVSDSRYSCSVSSPSRFSSMFSSSRRKKTVSVDDVTAITGKTPSRFAGEEHCHVAESLKQTPCRTGKGHSRSMSGLGFWLSPMVRPGQTANRNRNGITPEMVVNGAVTGEIRLPSKLYVSSGGGSLCKNGSRKIADFGRCNRDRTFH